MHIEPAQYRDIRSWLDLAAEAEPLFGRMLDDPAFYEALLRSIGRGTAFCVREADGPPGAPLVGGILWSPRRPDRPENRIGWLAVSAEWRRQGIGRRLVEHVLTLIRPPASLSVICFGAEVEAGQPARRFYESMGFRPAEAAPSGPEGGSRQVYRREIHPE